MIRPSDHPGPAYIAKGTCTWSIPLPINGAKAFITEDVFPSLASNDESEKLGDRFERSLRTVIPHSSGWHASVTDLLIASLAFVGDIVNLMSVSGSLHVRCHFWDLSGISVSIIRILSRNMLHTGHPPFISGASSLVSYTAHEWSAPRPQEVLAQPFPVCTELMRAQHQAICVGVRVHASYPAYPQRLGAQNAQEARHCHTQCASLAIFLAVVLFMLLRLPLAYKKPRLPPI